MYNKRVWLNREDSPSHGNVVAFDGIVKWHNEQISSTFLSISDCWNTIRLEKTDNDTVDDFINKMELLGAEIMLFVEYLTKHKGSVLHEAQSIEEIPEVRITAELKPVSPKKEKIHFHDRECDTCHEMYSPNGPRGNRCDKCRGVKKAKKDRRRSRVESTNHEDPKLHAGPPIEGPYSPV